MVSKVFTPRASWFSKYVPLAGSGCIVYCPHQDDHQKEEIRDFSGNGHECAITNVTWIRTAKGLIVPSLNGTNCRGVINNSTDFDVAGPFYVEMWILKDNIGDANQFVSRKQYAAGWDAAIWSNERLVFRQYNGTATKQIYEAFPSGATFAVDTWFHFVLGTDGTNLLAWVNGIAFTPVALAGTVTPLIGADMYIGWGVDGYWDGDWALFRFNSGTPTIQKAKYHYNQERHLFGV